MSVHPKAGLPLGVYVHFPFCARKCPYCDFNTRAARQIPHDAYLDAVLNELEGRKARFAGRRLVSIYFGGGTPGLWRPDCIGAVVRAIRSTWEMFNDPADKALSSLEVTVEINPRAAPLELLAALIDEGVNRLSIGVQTFDPVYLEHLGRDHSVEQSGATLEAARTAGFDRISFDLLFGGPHHTREAFERDLDRACAQTEADHISAYSLIVEPGTPFARMKARGRLHATDEDEAAEMLYRCETRLGQAGFNHYEVANYTRPGRWARHNSLYWVGAEYMGLGVGAHELAILPDGTPVRRAGALTMADYLADPVGSAQDEEHLDNQTHLAERLFLGLRTRFGVSLNELRRQFGSPAVDVMVPRLERLREQGWVEVVDGKVWGETMVPTYLQAEGPWWVPTAAGMHFADRIALEFL
ncbi:MAG: radical SAM family heme chaperone HemW [Myxococcota bacterium]